MYINIGVFVVVIVKVTRRMATANKTCVSGKNYRLWRLYFGVFAAILEIFNVKEWSDL